MRADNDHLGRWLAVALERGKRPAGRTTPQRHGTRRRAVAAPSAGNEAPHADDIDRIIGLLEATSGRIKTLDLHEVEDAFATQAAALDAIFYRLAHAAGRKYSTVDGLRLALTAQAHCRETHEGLLDLNAPRGPGIAREERSTRTKKSREQTIENAKSDA
jgi:hypothetical protein